MNATTKLLTTCLTVLRLALIAPGANAMDLSVGRVAACKGQVIDVPVNAKDAANLVNLELALKYDPAVLQYKGVKTGSLLGDNPNVFTNADNPGVVGIILDTLKGAQGDGVICTVQFTVLSESGAKSPLTISHKGAWEEKDLLELYVNAEDGEVTVESAFPWLYLGLAIGSLGILFLIARRIRRKRLAPASAYLDATSFVQHQNDFRHQCSRCACAIDLPQAMTGRQFQCAACGCVEIGV